MLKRGRESKQPLSIQIVNSETPKRDKKWESALSRFYQLSAVSD
jgi:hypothetical protein